MFCRHQPPENSGTIKSNSIGLFASIRDELRKQITGMDDSDLVLLKAGAPIPVNPPAPATVIYDADPVVFEAGNLDSFCSVDNRTVPKNTKKTVPSFPFVRDLPTFIILRRSKSIFSPQEWIVEAAFKLETL
ncbi:predicted protein [Coccidioides posadasii str. Silveira]|uniref:Predicted protein n=2 Tax=Coccidioides posadasii TaxID=199306 RepID=E9D104_COCPS|nr:predicted protein [Coccidioides posadasii str. Silveira]KMM73422.1 hypothetical protein CPAG_09711 [Coccidioides posadasii RMSCC 3488]